MSKQFEEAVFAFVKALDASAEVVFDHKVPDRDTGTPRQVDVWMNAKIGGHIPVSILVSCKRYKHRKVDIAHIGTFLSEIRATGASTGVMYSSSGFTGNALRKAQANGVACCRLYVNQPADMPDPLIFRSSFVCSSSFTLGLEKGAGWQGATTWNHLFDLRIRTPMGPMRTIEILKENFKRTEKQMIENALAAREFPSPWTIELPLPELGPNLRSGKVAIHGQWKIYQGRLEGQYLNGSYCFPSESFVGTQTSPPVDMESADPGPGWELVETTPRALPSSSIVIYRYGGDFETAARDAIGEQTI